MDIHSITKAELHKASGTNSVKEGAAVGSPVEISSENVKDAFRTVLNFVARTQRKESEAKQAAESQREGHFSKTLIPV